MRRLKASADHIRHEVRISTGCAGFYTHLPRVLGTKRDSKLIIPRPGCHCARCGDHHGHVFNDEPQPTG